MARRLVPFLLAVGALAVSIAPAKADCNVEGGRVRAVADVRGVTFTGTLTAVKEGDGDTLTFGVDDVFAGRDVETRRLHSPECGSILWPEDGPLEAGDRFFISTSSADKAGTGNTIVYARRDDGSWRLVTYVGTPAAFKPTMTTAALLALTVPDALPPTSTEQPLAPADMRLTIGLVFLAAFVAALALGVGLKPGRRPRVREHGGTPEGSQ